MKSEWRPIAEWDDFTAEWEAHTDKYWQGETDAPVASWVAFGFPGQAEHESQPYEDQSRWVFALITPGEPLEKQFVAAFPLQVRAKSGASPCRCMNHFWDDMEVCSGEYGKPADWRDIMIEDYAEIEVRDVIKPWRPPFTHFCPVFLPPVPGTPYAHNARPDGTQAERLTTDGAETPANGAE